MGICWYFNTGAGGQRKNSIVFGFVLFMAWLFSREFMFRMMVGFLSGLLIDIMFSDLIGFYTLIYTVLGYANGFFRKIFYDDDIIMYRLEGVRNEDI